MNTCIELEEQHRFVWSAKKMRQSFITSWNIKRYTEEWRKLEAKLKRDAQVMFMQVLLGTSAMTSLAESTTY